MPKFSFPRYPSNAREFEALMRAVDAELQQRGILARQRPTHMGLLFHDAFGWAGLLYPPRELADQPGFDGPVLMAKAHRWYEEVYGAKLNVDFGPGHVPARIGNAIWRVRMPYRVGGRCQIFADRDLAKRGRQIAGHAGEPATLNVLCMIDDLTPGLAARFTDRDLVLFRQFFASALMSLEWAFRLEGDPLFEQARNDYSASVDDLLSTRYAQSRWASSQAVEKTFKGLMNHAGLGYSRSAKDHALVGLSRRLATAGVSLDDRIIAIATCPSAVRYGEIPSTESEALNANHAALGVWEMLSRSKQVAELLPKGRRLT